MDSHDTGPVDAFLDAVVHATIPTCRAWAPDIVLDATVPDWRFRMHGPDAVRAEYEHWFADPGQFAELRRIPIATGEVVEYLLAWTEQGIDHVAHHMHVLEVSDGHITSDTVMCGGRWPAELQARMREEQDARDARDGHVHP